MPSTQGAGTSNQQLYSLFPKKKKPPKKTGEPEYEEKRPFGQRKNETGLADKVSDWRAGPRPEPGRGSPSQSREKDKRSSGGEREPLGSPQRGSRSSGYVRRGSSQGKTGSQAAQTGPPLSFADMAKRGGGGRNVEETIIRMDERAGERVGSSRQTGPCLSQVVLNQISASTYGKIGRSSDVSKYVMGGRGQGLEDTNPANELEVEFREEEDKMAVRRKWGRENEDFEVEFSSAAPGPRSKSSTVNKISANTFQQIGNSSRTEGYVMQPVAKSWSAVVGGSKKKHVTTKSDTQVILIPSPPINMRLQARREDLAEERSKGEPTEYDRIRLKLKEGKEELTEEEREALRVKRRERRKREKENKKKEKEEEKRLQMLAPQTSKLHMVTRATLAQMTAPVDHRAPDQLNPGKGIKFEDEEYPDLASKPTLPKEKVISKEIRDEKGRLCQDRESNSEWETEEEKESEELALENEEALDSGQIKVVSDSGPVTYSSILKAKKAEKGIKPKGVIIPNDEMKKEIILDKTGVKEETVEKKKVRKKDPIEFDLLSALNTKKVSQSQKKGGSSQVLGGKVKKDQAAPKLVRNQLDSSAPTKKRGKEREGGKKKKKTLLKKIILAERQRKKTLREEAEKRRENRIKEGVFLKPLQPTETEEFLDLVKRFDALKSLPAEEEAKDENVLEFKTSPENDDVPEPELPEPIGLHAVLKAHSEDQAHLEVDTKVEEEEKAQLSLEERAKAHIHSRKFRPYCNQTLSPDLDTLIGSLMADLTRFQDNQHAKDPVKAKARRRYAVGLREALKFVKVHKVTCLLLAPDLEAVEARGGLDDTVGGLIREASKQDGQEVPVVFGMNRRKLGRACLRKVPVSCIAIMNPQGSDETYKSLLNLASELRQKYKDRLREEMDKLTREDSGKRPADSVVPKSAPVDLSTDPSEGHELPTTRASSVLSFQVKVRHQLYISASVLKAPEFVPSWERPGHQQYYGDNSVEFEGTSTFETSEGDPQYQLPQVCFQPLQGLPPWQPYSWNRGHKW